MASIGCFGHFGTWHARSVASTPQCQFAMVSCLLMMVAFVYHQAAHHVQLIGRRLRIRPAMPQHHECPYNRASWQKRNGKSGHPLATGSRTARCVFTSPVA